MSEGEQRDLQKFIDEQQLPAGFDRLPEEDQIALLRKLQEKRIDINAQATLAAYKSRNAEEDLDIFNDKIARLDHDRKVYSSKVTAETGSGRIDMQVRGGDTRFIVPILVVIGVIILAVIALFALG